MFNNNSDFERNIDSGNISCSSSSSGSTIGVATPDNAITTTNNSNNIANDIMNTTKTTNSMNTIDTNVNISLELKNEATPTRKPAELAQKPPATTTTIPTPAKTSTINDNGTNYFNRFDNRIAANLAAVINASPFRSSSCGRSPAAKAMQAVAKTAGTPMVGTPTSTRSSRIKGIKARISLSSCGGSVAHTTKSRTRLNSRTRNKLQSPVVGNADGTENENDSDSHSVTKPTSMNQWSSLATSRRQRPSQLNLRCNDNEKVLPASTSDDDNSPTELNNCKRLADKPPLVKRLTMGLLGSSEDARPLVNSFTPAALPNLQRTHSPHHNDTAVIATAAANYSKAYEPEKCIDGRFGDSCRQSLTSIPMLSSFNLDDNNEFELKKRYLRETSSANSSPKIYSNRSRLNGIHHLEGFVNSTCMGVTDMKRKEQEKAEAELKDAPWFQAGISRDIATEVLSTKSPGAFLVCRSSSNPGCYALTLRVPTPPEPKIARYMILPTTRGYKIKGSHKEFSTLKALITHHSVMPELLPIPLALPRPTNMKSSRRNLDDFDTYDSLKMLLKYLRTQNIEYE